MKIPGSKLHRYFASAIFPIAVLREVGDQVLMKITQEGLSTLISQGMVFGVGSKTKLHNVRLRMESAPLDVPEEDRVAASASASTSESGHPKTISFMDWRAETNFTVQRQQLSCGVVFRHHPKHCQAFSPTPGASLSASCL